MFRKGKTSIIAKFQRTDLVICRSNSREGEKPILLSNKYNTIVSYKWNSKECHNASK